MTDQRSIRTDRRSVLKTSAAVGLLGGGTTTASIPISAGDLDPEGVTEADWSMWRFNRANTGRNPRAAGPEDVDQRWEYTGATERTLYSPVVVDGVAYFGAFDSRMHAVDVETGEQLWTAPAGDIIQSTPTILDGVVYSAAYDGEIYAWDAQTGEEIWNVVGGGSGERTTSVTVDRDGETIFVGSDDAVYSLEPETGDINWVFETGDNLTASPSVARGVVYFGDWSGNLYAVDEDTGEAVWERQLGTDVRSTAAIVDGVLYLGVFSGGTTSDVVGTDDNEYPLDHLDESDSDVTTTSDNPSGLYAIDADDGEIIWSYEMDTVFSSPAVAEGLIFAGDYSGQFVALDRETGDLVWSYEFDGNAITSSPAYSDGVLYVGSPATDSELMVFEAETGDVLARRSIDNGQVFSPVVVDDEVYVTSGSDYPAELTAFEGDIEERALEGVVTNEDGTPVPDVDVYLVDRADEHGAWEFIDEYPHGELPPVEAWDGTDDEGTFRLGGADPGTYDLLVVPHEDSVYFPELFTGITFPQSGVEEIEVEIAERPLRQLDSSVEFVLNTLESTADTQTFRAASVYVDGVEQFAPQEDGLDYLADVAGLVDFTFDYGGNYIRAGVILESQDLAVDLAKRGFEQTLVNRWEIMDVAARGELGAGLRSLLEHDWVTEFTYQDMETVIENGYEETDTYQSTIDTIDDAWSDYLVLSSTEPSEGFSRSEAMEILDELRRQLGPYGPDGAAVLPNGETYQFEQTAAYMEQFRQTEDMLAANELLDRASQLTSSAGKALKVTGKGAPIGIVLWKLGKAGDFVTDLAEPTLRNRLADEWVLTSTMWADDLREVDRMTVSIVDWLEQVTQDGLESVDLEVVDVDLNLQEPVNPWATPYVRANEPEHPSWWSLGVVQTKAVHDATVSVHNDGTEPVDVRITMHDEYRRGQSVSEDGTIIPPVDEDPVTIQPGETREFETQYSSDVSSFDTHEMSTSVWANGTIRASENTEFNVRRGVTSPFGVNADEPVRSSQFVATAGHKPRYEPLDQEEYEGNLERSYDILSGEVSPDVTQIEETFTFEDDADEGAFVLSAPGTVALQVFDELGRLVGYDPGADESVAEIPGAEHTGTDSFPEYVRIPDPANETFTVRAVGYRFITDEPKTVEVNALEVPEREAIMAIEPAEIRTVVSPAVTRSVQVDVSEIGDQIPIDGGTVDIGPFTDSEGNELPDVDVTVVDTTFGVEAGDSTAVELQFDAAETIDLPETGDARFEAEMTVETDNAGTLSVDVSTFVLDSDVPGARLTAADESLDWISLSDGDFEVDSETLPVDVQPEETFEIESEGSGEYRIELETFDEPRDVDAFTRNGDGWEHIQTGTSGGALEIVLDETLDGEILFGTGLVQVDATDNGRRATDTTGDNLLNDVNGDGEFDIFDVQALFSNMDEINERFPDDTEYFDFSGESPDEVTIFDVQALFSQLQDNGD